MRINKYLAQATGISRRAADSAIQQGRVAVNGLPVEPGQDVTDTDNVTLDNSPVKQQPGFTTIILNKPAGFVVSREGQGSKTIYELLPNRLHHLKPVGRLDKDSSGLLLLTNDGQLANSLTHPRYEKTKIYEVRLDKALAQKDQRAITEQGVNLEDGPSRFELANVGHGQNLEWIATLKEGRNRQIRRTFAALGYRVKKLHRTKFGDYELPTDLESGRFSAELNN
jgi:23S rRNA pseudouridine2605 synthase